MHILCECTTLTRFRGLVKDWLSNFNVQDFKHTTILEMTDIKDVPNYIISLCKDIVWINRRLAQLRDISEQAVMNSLDSSLRFYVYINHAVNE